MKQVVTYTLCDRVNIHEDASEDAEETPLLNSKGKKVVVDLCKPCRTTITLDQAIELADAIGQPLPEAKQTRNRTSKPAPGPCQQPGCDADFPTWQGLSIHSRRTHNMILTEDGKQIPA